MVVVLERINMAIASSIGLVAEAIHRHKTPERPIESENDIARYPVEDEQWALDELQDELCQEEPSDSEDQPKKKIRNPAKLADDFLKRYPPPPSGSAPAGRLPLPVIIPQRRPGVRVRGFVRAYAPDLQACGIDQDTFMDFLVTMTRAGRAPQWMGAANLTAAAAFALPGHAIGCGVGFAIQVVNAIAMEMRGRVQANGFLQKLNQGFFQPRGLYCLVLSFDNTHEEAMTDESLATAIATTTDPKTGVRKYTDKLRSHSGTTGPSEFPESAPLVFPVLDWLETNANAEQAEKLGRYKKFRKFVADYYDRRAQAEYAARNPTSPLAAPPRRGFTSKLADPNDDTNKSPISLATGGLVPYNTTWRETRNSEGRRPPRKIADKVLYMIIVNMPSDDDMSRAESIMATEATTEPSVQSDDAEAAKG